MMNGFEWMKTCLISYFAVPEHLIKENAGLIDDIGFDSLDVVELVMRVEDEFGEISDEQLEAFLTVGDVVRLINDREPQQVPA